MVSRTLSRLSRYNRPYFEEQGQEVLRKIDMIDFEAYYSRSPASGIWILEYGSKFIGLIAVDASLDSESEQTLSSNVDDPQNKAIRKQIGKKGTSSVATIRHFYIMEEYRRAFVQEDLLHFAVSHAFKDPKVKVIRAVDATYDKWKAAAFTKEGFSVEKELRRIGVLRWIVRSRELTRERWEEKQKSSSS